MKQKKATEQLLKAQLKKATEQLLKTQSNEAYKLIEQLNVTFDNLLRAQTGKVQCPVCTKIQTNQLQDMESVVWLEGDFEHSCEFCKETFLVEFEYVPYVKTSYIQDDIQDDSLTSSFKHSRLTIDPINF